MRPVGPLYLPPGGKYFGCRRCHKPVYLSSRESHRNDKYISTTAAMYGVSRKEVSKAMREGFL